MLLQKVKTKTDKPRSDAGLKLAFYMVSLVLAFLGGIRYERGSNPAATPVQLPADVSTPAQAKTDVSQPAEPAIPSATPQSTKPAEPQNTYITPLSPSSPTARLSVAAATSTPVRIERAIALDAPAPTPGKPVAVLAAASPVKPSGGVTILEPVQIPVKDGGRIVGYINLQKGQQITPVGVEKDKVKIKCGDSIVFVPVNSTDMPR